MRKSIFAILACLSLVAAVPARAQLDLEISTVDPLTKLPAEKWTQLALRLINPANIVGRDSVYMVNATGEDLSAVTCRGYFLVGSKTYITSNKTVNAPSSLPKWSITLVPTEGFDTYCKSGVEATGTVSQYTGVQNAGDKSFSGSTFVIFNKAK